MIKLVILDRDGVINFDSPDYIKSPEEWRAIPGSLEAIAQLNHAGFKVAVASNQSGIGRGYYDLAMLEKIHQKMLHELKEKGGHLDALYFCPHKPEDKCHCRKPKPGLLEKILDKLSIGPHEAVMIGDSKRDIEAAFAVGTQAIYIHPQATKLYPGVSVYRDLSVAVKAILKNPGKVFGEFPQIDFSKDRYQKISRNELLLKAVGLKNDYHPSVVDLTAGLGRDAYLLYLAGCKVQLVERSALIAGILQKTLQRAQCEVPIFIGEAKDYLSYLLHSNHYPEVIYFDPIFPEKSKNALAGKESRLLRAIVGEDSDAAEVFGLALKVAKKRVIVKRPLYCETITAQTPSIEYKGKSVRFDVYLIK